MVEHCNNFHGLQQPWTWSQSTLQALRCSIKNIKNTGGNKNYLRIKMNPVISQEFWENIDIQLELVSVNICILNFVSSWILGVNNSLYFQFHCIHSLFFILSSFQIKTFSVPCLNNARSQREGFKFNTHTNTTGPSHSRSSLYIQETLMMIMKSYFSLLTSVLSLCCRVVITSHHVQCPVSTESLLMVTTRVSVSLRAMVSSTPHCNNNTTTQHPALALTAWEIMFVNKELIISDDVQCQMFKLCFEMFWWLSGLRWWGMNGYCDQHHLHHVPDSSMTSPLTPSHHSLILMHRNTNHTSSYPFAGINIKVSESFV